MRAVQSKADVLGVCGGATGGDVDHATEVTAGVGDA